MIYHVTNQSEWEQASPGDFYQPAAFEQDGFIHCCEAGSIEYVGNHYYRGQNNLVILWVDPDLVQAPIRYEDLVGGGTLFPHIYGALNRDAVQQVVVFKPNSDGTFSRPADIKG